MPLHLAALLLLVTAGEIALPGDDVSPIVADDIRTLDGALVGKPPGPLTQPIFSSYTPGDPFSQGLYTRNSALWLGSRVDLSFIMAHNSMGGYQWGPQVISPRHGIFAWHITEQNFKVGTQAQYVDANNNVSTRTIAAMTQILGTDIGICAFDRELPVGIKPAKVLPADWPKYLGPESLPFPVCFTDGQATPYRYLYCGQINSLPGANVVMDAPTGALRPAFDTHVIVGDSSSPLFMVIHHQAVLLGCFQGGGFGSAPFVSYYHSQIDANMKRLSVYIGAEETYQLSDIDLSGFATSPEATSK